MVMSARVTRVSGRIIGEKRGGVMRRFSHDPQGNTVAVYNTSGTETDSFVYWPYGEVRVRTGSSTIVYQYSGAWGSYTDTSGRNYNVHRYLRKDLGRWMTLDPLWPDERAYVYASGSPSTWFDARGLKSCRVPTCCTREVIGNDLADKASHCDKTDINDGGWTKCPSASGLKAECLKRISSGKIDCATAEKWIEDALALCHAIGSGGYNEDYAWAGTVVCCHNQEGYPESCGSYCCKKNMDADPCRNLCLVRHEQYHERECKSGVRINPGTQGGFDFNEACAYLTQAKCLYALFKGQCGWKSFDFEGLEQCRELTKDCIP